MNVENSSSESVTDIIKVEIKVENVSDNEVESDIDLYTDHVIKEEEMVIRPVVLQVVDVTYCPEDVPVPKKPKLETTDEETYQVQPEKGMKEDNTEGIISNVIFNKTNTTSRNTKQRNLKCNQTPGLSENVFICNECGKQFRKKCELTQHGTCHQKKSHCDYECKDSSSNLSIHAHTEEKPYSCSHCGYKCKHKGHLFTHLLIHTSQKPYSCLHCDYKCKQKGRLSRHLRIHSGENPYSCSHCDYKCKQKGNLSRHLRIHTADHTAEKPYSCSQCDYKCKQNSDLSKHKRTHTDEKPYSCSYCDYKCRQKSHLLAHLRIHTGEKPYSCAYCDYKCKQKSHLSEHSRIHTGDKKRTKK